MPTPVAVAPAPNAPAAAAPAAAKPVAPGAAPAPGAEEPLFEITVDGQPQKYTRKQLEKFAGKGAFADRLARQAKEALRATQADRERQTELKKRLKEDKAAREAFLREHGIDPDELSRERLAEKLREHEMTPEQRAIAERDAKIADLERAKKTADDEKAEQRLSAAAQVKQRQIEGELAGAWERAGFEKGADSFFAVYEVMQEFSDLGLLDASEPFSATMADRIIEQARSNMEGTDKRREAAILKGLKGQALVERLGKAVVDEVLRYKVEQIRGGGARRPPTFGQGPASAAGPTSTFISPQEAMKKMRGGV